MLFSLHSFFCFDHQDYGDDNYDDDDDAGGCGADITLDENGLSQQQQGLAFGGDGLVAPPNKVCIYIVTYKHFNLITSFYYLSIGTCMEMFLNIYCRFLSGFIIGKFLFLAEINVFAHFWLFSLSFGIEGVFSSGIEGVFSSGIEKVFSSWIEGRGCGHQQKYLNFKILLR